MNTSDITKLATERRNPRSRDIDRLTTAEMVSLINSEDKKVADAVEKVCPQIAAAIERVRTDRPIETTLELVDIIRSAMPPSALREKQHPAKRSFQAIRIAVNDELGAVRQGMEAAIDHLNPGGRLVVITFHSLEDRIVKNVFQNAAKGCTCPPSFPVCVCGRKPKIRILTKKPIIATREEVEENPRSRSAKLRVAERV